MIKEKIHNEIEECLRSSNMVEFPEFFKEKVAYLLGIEIEGECAKGVWTLITVPLFEGNIKYRIKSEESYRPFTYDDIKDRNWNEWHIIDNNYNRKMDLVGIGKEGFITDDNYYSYKEAFDAWSINRGVCGVKI